MNFKKLMKLMILVNLVAGFLIVSFIGSCSSVDTVSGGVELEGWKTDLNTRVDTFFIKSGARASDTAIEKDDQRMMQATCVEGAKLLALDILIRKMVGETVEAQSGMLDGQTTNFAITSIRSGQISGVQQKECGPSGPSGSWINCECVHYVSGVNLKKKIQMEVTKASQK
ncbi:MAG: hypothetical protein H3C43_11340 [Leptonema sp. (in: Bacteria)]|nr:hypothetical protein [Leptonema sp. (in: bacteria)]